MIEEIKPAIPEVVAPVEPEVPKEKTPAELEAAAIEARKKSVQESIKVLVEALVNDPCEFTVDELGWASDAFSQWLKIRSTATKEHEEFAAKNTAAQDEFYSKKFKDLTFIYNDKPVEAAPTESGSVVV